MLSGLLGAQMASASHGTSGPGICSTDESVSCAFDTDCSNHGGGTCSLPIAGAETLSNQICMETAAGTGLTCTANDVRVAGTSSLIIVDGCEFPGDTATLSFVAQFELGAQDRYDVGVWIAQDGGNALTGSCSVSNFPVSPTPPWTDLDNFCVANGPNAGT